MSSNIEQLLDELLAALVKRRLDALAMPQKLRKLHLKPNGKLKRKYTKKSEFWKKPHPRKKS